MQLQFSIVQSNILWQQPEANHAHFEQLIAAHTSAGQVVVLPEMFSTGFSMDCKKLAQKIDGTTVQWMKQVAASQKIILCGSIIIEEEGRYYNRLLWVQPNGVVHGYNKRHLFALAGEHEHYTAGTERVIVQANGIKICLQICYDLRFPVWSRQQRGNEYDVLLYVANWPTPRHFAWQQLLIARAIENQCYAVGVNRIGIDGNGLNYSGGSTILHPLGNAIAACHDVECVTTALIDTDEIVAVRARQPFLNDGDEFILR